MASAGDIEQVADQVDAAPHLPRRFGWAVGLIFLAAAVRLGSLLTAPALPPDLTPVRVAVSQWLAEAKPLPIDDAGSISGASLPATLVELGVERIDVQRFDPTALVMIRAGLDGQPGVAGVDDNGDALVDDRSELGATRSDDVCVVVKADDRPPPDEPTLVMQRGAFVGVKEMVPQEDGVQQRYIVMGQSRDDRWSFLVVP